MSETEVMHTSESVSASSVQTRSNKRVKVAWNTAPLPAVPVAEWNHIKRWNPFNSYKLLAHVERWRRIKRGKPLPAPVLVTVDPSNVCNLDCDWCNAAYIRSHRKRMLSKSALLHIADFLPNWGEGGESWEPGVKAVCIAGGGEPLLNPATGAFIDRLVQNEIEVGVVTNGLLINRYTDALSQCTWVGVSIDAATAATYNRYKGLPANNRSFDKILSNIATLTDYARRHNSRLGLPHPGYGVSYKYLLYKDNIGEVADAAELARSIGCKNIHFRPAGATWDNKDTEDAIRFTPEEISLFSEQIRKAQTLDRPGFGVYGVTHKFNTQFAPNNCFSTCHAVFMTAIFGPPASQNADEDSFVLALCCDRRGDPKLELLRDVVDVRQINKVWGSPAHWAVHDAISVHKDCPRCTYQPHNEIYEQVILDDSMTHVFI
ncbi:radical SAM protein [Allochromatium vinosum]|uniref:radical SAM protein n=1 Tax=Allochromatium vinosum TaxID=1049 RepID=UPI001906D101|nr:radical SAM protein [Allochromatium vinosum]